MIKYLVKGNMHLIILSSGQKQIKVLEKDKSDKA